MARNQAWLFAGLRTAGISRSVAQMPFCPFCYKYIYNKPLQIYLPPCCATRRDNFGFWAFVARGIGAMLRPAGEVMGRHDAGPGECDAYYTEEAGSKRFDEAQGRSFEGLTAGGGNCKLQISNCKFQIANFKLRHCGGAFRGWGMVDTLGGVRRMLLTTEYSFLIQSG